MVAAVGYANLTIERVAARAGTSKPVLYRRWPNRAQLVLSAMRQRVVPIARDISDTGSYAATCWICFGACHSATTTSAKRSCEGLMAELPDVQDEIFQVLPDVMLTILDNAANRGEVNPAKITPRIA